MLGVGVGDTVGAGVDTGTDGECASPDTVGTEALPNMPPVRIRAPTTAEAAATTTIGFVGTAGA
jgi:hypothetical protein